jgi:hypothetical protein
MAAWRLGGEHFSIPELNLACSGLAPHVSESDWVKLAGNDGLACEQMRRLYWLMENAPTLGSLIEPMRLEANVFSSGTERVLPMIAEALKRERGSEEMRELAIAAQGVLAAFQIMAHQFTLVVTNVPYLGRWRQSDELAEFCRNVYSDSKADLATCFVDRCMKFLSDGGTAAVVSKQEPLFLGQYKQHRIRLLKCAQWDFVVKLGPRAFETISGERVNVALLSFTQTLPRIDHTFIGLDVSKEKSPAKKAKAIRDAASSVISQREQLDNPDSRIIFEVQPSGSPLKDYVSALAGHLVGDSARFERFFWEVPVVSPEWEFLQSTVDESCSYGGKSGIILWENERGQMYRLAQSVKHMNHVAQNWLRGKPNWGKRGVIISEMSNLPATLYLGQIYDCNCCALVPHKDQDLPAIWAYCSSEQFARDVRRLDQNLKVHPRTLIKVPFDLAHWQTIASATYQYGLPEPTSADPTQWLFSGHPKESDHQLQVAVARLVGYAWPRQTGSSFPGCAAVGLDGLEKHADPDGIVCLSSIAGEASATDRMRELLIDVYGREWSAAKLSELLGGCESLEFWLRDRFFEEHCRIFQQRPFIWHIWDGRKDGFHALLNYHKLAASNGQGRKTLEKLIYTSLGDWIARQRTEVVSGIEGADARLTAALHLKAELEKILAGEKPYDIFIRWKPLREQPCGWEPDINDGVRLNIRPWLTTTFASSTPSKKDACILRITPKINYGKDRGKEPHCPKDELPWFWTWDEQTDNFEGGKDFDGARWSDLHYSPDVKKKARELKKQRGEKG